jgi:hypothetical protein
VTSVQTSPAKGRHLDSTDIFCLLLLAALAAKFVLSGELSRPTVQAWTTVFVAICVPAAPFVALGIAVSTAIAVFVPPSFFTRVLPTRQGLAVPVAGLAGGILPGCECGSVPVAASLSRRGVKAGPALAFLLSAPAVSQPSFGKDGLQGRRAGRTDHEQTHRLGEIVAGGRSSSVERAARAVFMRRSVARR